jgi:hypothetical protein
MPYQRANNNRLQTSKRHYGKIDTQLNVSGETQKCLKSTHRRVKGFPNGNYTWGQCLSNSVGRGDCVVCTALATEQLDFLSRALPNALMSFPTLFSTQALCVKETCMCWSSAYTLLLRTGNNHRASNDSVGAAPIRYSLGRATTTERATIVLEQRLYATP